MRRKSDYNERKNTLTDFFEIYDNTMRFLFCCYDTIIRIFFDHF